ncbi:SDR family oxidoreductase [Paenibacillus prosopidis]|uniref:NAD(P)H dehydrogenase (Quinone) n=1 Tax=Paenibacillus prosopidis TaxID=630520 RepID=A0A368VKN1_9BACL|nr:SDR family oxidoreductase [Paenibacillus prosopidis]RCW42261.1 NAD(P)H dehydrogenase (quinone) [Paenibacillus prosopidis]
MKTTKETLLVTGASGNLGRLAVEWLLRHYNGPIIATTRNPEKLSELSGRGVTVRKADFDKPETLEEAFAGAQRLLLVSTDAIAVSGLRMKQHTDAVQASVKAGVKHIVYTSIPNPEPGSACLIAGDHYATEEMIKNSGLSYTILRNNLYADNLLPSLPQAVATGHYATAAGDGKTAYVTRQDCANTAAAALASSSTDKQIVDVTGAEALSGSDIAQIASEITGKSIQFVSLEAAQLVGIYESVGIPNGFAQVLVSFDTASSKGEYSQTSQTVQQLTGSAPASVKQFLTDNKQLFASAE